MPNCWIYVTLPESKKESLVTNWSDRKCISKNYLKTVLVSKVVCKQDIFAIVDATIFHTHLHYYFLVSLVSYKQSCNFSTEKGKLEFQILKLWLYQHTVETHDRHFSWTIQNSSRQHAFCSWQKYCFSLSFDQKNSSTSCSQFQINISLSSSNFKSLE